MAASFGCLKNLSESALLLPEPRPLCSALLGLASASPTVLSPSSTSLKTRSIRDLVNPVQQELSRFHFINKDQRDALLPDLRFLVLLLHKLQTTRLAASTRMKSISFRIFLCSLHTWMSCVISGLMETSLVLSTLDAHRVFPLTMMELFGISTS